MWTRRLVHESFDIKITKSEKKNLIGKMTYYILSQFNKDRNKG